MDPIQLPMTIVEREGYDENNKSEWQTSNGHGVNEKQIPMSKQVILIMLIAQEPAIFNTKHEDYRNALKKDELWTKIANRVGWTEQNCKNKWKALRDQYCRELKRTRVNTNVTIKWKFFQHLEFLRPYALHRNYRSKMTTSSQPENSQEDQKAHIKHETEDETTSSSKYRILSSMAKSENWNASSNSSELNESCDITEQIMDQISHSDCNGMIVEEPQDDEDDDPIHTFLNIESYFEKELITMVQYEELLYNFNLPSYKNVKAKLLAWEEIARKLKRTVRQCRLKWKALRDQYIREHKRLQCKGNGNGLTRWKHYDALSFLEKFIRQKSDSDCSFLKAELKFSIDSFDVETAAAQSVDEDQELRQFIVKRENTSQMFANCGHTQRGENEEQVVLMAETKPNEEPTEESNDTSSVVEDNDEVDAFFRAVAIKIRKANMSAVALTELQIDILRVITNALQDN